jgi:hypothetical protein
VDEILDTDLFAGAIMGIWVSTDFLGFLGISGFPLISEWGYECTLIVRRLLISLISTVKIAVQEV